MTMFSFGFSAVLTVLQLLYPSMSDGVCSGQKKPSTIVEVFWVQNRFIQNIPDHLRHHVCRPHCEPLEVKGVFIFVKLHDLAKLFKGKSPTQ